MSIEILLIPAGIAAYAALKEHREAARLRGSLPLRVTDPELLIQALDQLGATDVAVDESTITASLEGEHLTVRGVDELLLLQVVDGTEEQTAALVEQVDQQVGQALQEAKVEEMRTRAAQLGLVLVGEVVAEDGTVQMIFEEAG